MGLGTRWQGSRGRPRPDVEEPSQCRQRLPGESQSVRERAGNAGPGSSSHSPDLAKASDFGSRSALGEPRYLTPQNRVCALGRRASRRRRGSKVHAVGRLTPLWRPRGTSGPGHGRPPPHTLWGSACGVRAPDLLRPPCSPYGCGPRRQFRVAPPHSLDRAGFGFGLSPTYGEKPENGIAAAEPCPLGLLTARPTLPPRGPHRRQGGLSPPRRAGMGGVFGPGNGPKTDAFSHRFGTEVAPPREGQRHANWTLLGERTGVQ